MNTFTIPDIDIDFEQHPTSQSVSSDTEFLYRKARERVRQDIRIMDLGSGCGVLLLMLAKDFPELYYTGIEVQKELVDISITNLSKLSRYLQRQIEFNIINADYADIHYQLPKYHIILSNPPYYPAGSGRLSPFEEKNIARFETTATQKDLLQCVKNNLTSDGVAFIVYPISRAAEFQETCEQVSLRVVRFEAIDYESTGKKQIVIFEVVNATDK